MTIINGNVSYGNILATTSQTNTAPFTFSVVSGAGYNHVIPFTLTVTDTTGYSNPIYFTVTTESGNVNKSGTIGVDTTWTNDKTYHIVGNVGVAPGKTLTIQAGTTVKLDGNFSLNVGGALIADGTQSQPICFISNSGGAWGRIYFDDPSLDAVTDTSGTYLGGNILRWVQISGAAQGISCNNATPYLSPVTTDGGGVSCANGDTPLWLKDSDLTGSVQGSGGGGAAMGTWTARANMPTARAGLGLIATDNGKLYAIGGHNDTNRLATVEEYDPTTNVWTDMASSMPTARSMFGIAAVNGKIYAIGGYGNNGSYLSTVEEYDPATDIWTTRSSMPTARYSLGAASVNGKIYAIGGIGVSNSFVTTVEEYDPAADTWKILASMPTAREGMGVVAANGKIYAIGGENNNGLSSAVEEYNPAENNWTMRASMPTARYVMGVATANGKIYAVGGVGGSTFISTVEEYDLGTNTWVARASMPTARCNFGMASANGKIYAVGGFNGSYPSTVEEYTPPSAPYNFHVLQSTIHNGNLSVPFVSEIIGSTIDGSITAGDSSSVQSTTASVGISITGDGIIKDSTVAGTVNLTSGIAQNNTITNGNISLSGSGQILSNKISGGGISTGTGSTVQDNNLENAPGWSIQSSGSVSIIHNRLVGNVNGVQTQGGLVQNNLIANITDTGVEVNGDTNITGNTFTDISGSAIKLISGTNLQITNNNFEFNTGLYDIENLILQSTLSNIPAAGNWWGSTDLNTVDGRIFDYNDEYTKTLSEK